ncbi:MAG: hypothetical protein ACRDBY_00750 [Cetobacterium sp.]
MNIKEGRIVLKFDNYNRLVDCESIQNISESFFGLDCKVMFVRNAMDLDTLVLNNTISKYDSDIIKGKFYRR